jgi:hypothetical protein
LPVKLQDFDVSFFANIFLVELYNKMRTSFFLTAFAAIVAQVSGHLVLTYPGSRGNNLHNSGNGPDGISVPEDGLGVSYVNGSLVYPYGMQWIYPCKRS